VSGAEGSELGRYEAGRQSRDSDARGHGRDEAVDPAADAHAAERQPGPVQGPADLGPGDAGRRVDHERQRPGQVEPGRGRADPDQTIPLDQLAALLAARALADEHIELVALQALVQQAALVDRQVEFDERVVPAEVAQDLRQPGEGEVVRDADAEPPARPGSAEVRGRLLAGGEDVARESGHRLAVGGQRHRVRVPQHERPADLVLQAAYVLADGGLLDAEPGRGPGEATGLLDGEKGGQELRIVSGH
jgi:hypothetical protein